MTSRAMDPVWQRVAAAYRLFGLEPLLDAKVTPMGFVYANGVAALASNDDSAVALHDLAHYLTAAARRQRAPNFGMGEHPAVCEPGEHAARSGVVDLRGRRGRRVVPQHLYGARHVRR